MSLAQRTAHIGLARLRLLLRRAGARPKLFFGIAGLLGILAVVLGYSGLAYASLRQAGQDARAMQDELLGVTPLALTRPDTFSELADMALRLEQSAVAARRWLTALRALTWFPILGGKARERMELLDLAASGAGVTRKVSHAYSRAFVIPPEATSSEAIVDAIGRSLKSDAASFADAQRELTRIGEVIDGLGETALGARAREQLGRYLPYLEAVVHLSRVAPEVVGDAYVLYRTLDSLRDLTDNPLKVMETPSAVRDSLRAADRESVALSARLDLVLLAAQGNGPSEERLSRRALDVLRLTQQQVQVLNRATRGLDAMVAVTELGDEEGFLTPRFGGRARGELERASREFTLARQELAALQALLNTQDVTAQETFASLLGAGLGASSSSPDFMAGLLEDADLFSQFLYTFLGYSGPRTYLLLGQNENEPRGSGGFLGVVAQATVSDGVLAPLKYYDSGNLNQQPASLNPPSPPGYYWYFYMSHMLFQDANWYPHFPATAELLAEMFRRKTGVQADGVLTANKRLTLDLVELFGDIRVPGHDGPLDRAKANEYQETEDLYACRPGRSIDRGKRCFDEDLFFAFVEHLQGGIASESRSKFASLFQSALDRKDIMVHLFDSAGPAADLPWRMAWNGAVRLVDHDYLMVVDTSLGTHVVPDLVRSLDYRVELRLSEPSQAQFRMRYENRAERTIPICRDADLTGTSTCYFNYVRVYVSPSALGISSPPIPLHEGMEKLSWGHLELDTATVVKQRGGGLSGLTEIGGYVAVEPSHVVTVPAEWLLDPAAIRRTGPDVYLYQLLIQKQSGVDIDHVAVSVKLPPGGVLLGSSSGARQPGDGWVVMEQPLTTDQVFSVTFRAPGR